MIGKNLIGFLEATGLAISDVIRMATSDKVFS